MVAKCSRFSSLWLGLVSALLIFGACKERGRPSVAPPAAHPQAETPEPRAHAAATESATPSPPPATKTEGTPAIIAQGAKGFDRKTLEQAYVEIACIQKKGEAIKLLAAYKKYGFADPNAWIKAWKSQKKSPDYEQWLAGLTQRAWKACP